MRTAADVHAPAVLVRCICRRRCDCLLWLVAACPYCGERHTHGAGRPDEDPSDLLSRRVAHCGRGGYVLVETPFVSGEARARIERRSSLRVVEGRLWRAAS